MSYSHEISSDSSKKSLKIERFDTFTLYLFERLLILHYILTCFWDSTSSVCFSFHHNSNTPNHSPMQTNMYYLEKEMETHSSALAWKIPWTEEPARLQSMGSQRVGHGWATSLSISLSCWSYNGRISSVAFPLCKYLRAEKQILRRKICQDEYFRTRLLDHKEVNNFCFIWNENAQFWRKLYIQVLWEVHLSL